MKPSGIAAFFREGFVRYIVAFGITVVLAVFLLVVSAFLPQYIIQGHVADSVDFILQDYENNSFFDRSPACQMDVLTDAMMLRTSLSTNDNYLGSVLTNPVYTYEGLEEWKDVEDMLVNQAFDMPHNDVWFYCRYWMGFRAVLRMALMVLNVAQIKRYLAFVFFTLFMSVICSVANKTNSKIAFLFAMSVVLVRPHVIASSMQYNSCFLITFLAMLLIPWIHRRPEYEGLFFMEIGMLTMYFDFYTVPLITMGFPLVYLLVLKLNEGKHESFRDFLRNLSIWFAGYVFMWIAKLVLTTVLTTQNALLQGFQAFSGRVGITKDPELEQYYSLDFAFERLREVIFSDDTGMIIYLLGVGFVVAVAAWKLLRGHVSRSNIRNSVPFLLLALLPFGWFVITKQPVAIHAFFQYRNIALTYWASAMFLYFLLQSKEKRNSVSQN